MQDAIILGEAEEEPSLRDYQVADMAFYFAEPKCMNLSDPGTGKTPSVVVKQGDRWTSDGIATVWVQPKSLLAKNRDEILRFNKNLHPDEVVIFDGAAVKKHAGRKDVAVWLMGPDRFKRQHEYNKDSKGEILNLRRINLPENARAIDVDEFHMCFAGAASGRTRAYFDFHERRAVESIVMTGTLVHGRIDTVYPAIHAIEPRYYAGYEAFLRHHAYMDEYGKPFAWKNHDRIAQILARHAIRHTFEDVYGKEAKVIIPEDADMTPRQREYYQTFLETLTVDLGEAILDGSASAQTLLVGRKIMEIPFHIKDPRGDEFPVIDLLDGGLAGKEELLELHFADHVRTGKPLVVFATFVKQQERIVQLAEKAGLRSGLMNGSTSSKQRQAIDEGFRRGELDLIVATPQVAAFGYNWQYWGPQQIEVDHVVFASMDYMDTNFLQAYRRFIRGQRKTPLRISVLRYRNSMDSRVFDIIEQKSKDANKIDASRQIYRFNEVTEEVEMVV